jgi:hypothetical protein
MDPHTPRLPFPFNMIPYIMFFIWIGILCLVIYASYSVLTSGLEPEDIGLFFGRIVDGFQRGVAK